MRVAGRRCSHRVQSTEAPRGASRASVCGAFGARMAADEPAPFCPVAAKRYPSFRHSTLRSEREPASRCCAPNASQSLAEDPHGAVTASPLPVPT